MQADKLGLTLTVGLLTMAAVGARPRGIPWVNRDDWKPGQSRLVREEYPELRERPAMTRRRALRLFALLWAGAIVLGAVSLFAQSAPLPDNLFGRFGHLNDLRPIRIGTNWNHKCPVCQLEGRLSTVSLMASGLEFIETTAYTRLPTEAYWDEQGRFHVHDSNVTTVTYRCSHGHPFYQLHQSPCPLGDWPAP